MLADARAPALFASAPDALVLADARPTALLAMSPFALVRADARAPAVLALAPFALVLQMLAPLTPCIRSSGAGAGRCLPAPFLPRLRHELSDLKL